VSRFALYVDGVPMVSCPSTLAEAAESARTGARGRPGVPYEVENQDGEVVARYEMRDGKMERWVR
jgi:hypothetical protein